MLDPEVAAVLNEIGALVNYIRNSTEAAKRDLSDVTHFARELDKRLETIMPEQQETHDVE